MITESITVLPKQRADQPFYTQKSKWHNKYQSFIVGPTDTDNNNCKYIPTTDNTAFRQCFSLRKDL